MGVFFMRGYRTGTIASSRSPLSEGHVRSRSPGSGAVSSPGTSRPIRITDVGCGVRLKLCREDLLWDRERLDLSRKKGFGKICGWGR